jgi:membrane-associated phospholipid phosphatase
VPPRVVRRASCALFLSALAVAPADTRAQPAPAERPPVLGARDAAVAGGFAAAGALTAPFDRALADRLQHPAVQANRALRATAVTFRDVAQPGLYVILPAIWAAGALADDRTTAAAGLHGIEAVGVALTVVGAGKMIAGRARPSVPGRDPTSWRLVRGLREGSEYRSFPSGHTAAAFAAASAITAELAARRPSLRWSAGVPLYLGAATTGWARMYENRHWATDVVGGAAIGTVAGLAVARWHRTRPDNAIDRRLLGVGLAVGTAGPRLVLVPLGAAPRRAAAGNGAR